MICRICKLDIDPDSFGNNKRKPNGKSNFCKECKKNIDSISYNKRRDKIIKQKLNKIKIIGELVQELKTSCIKCGETKKYMLDFHHIDEKKKDFTIGGKVSQNPNFDLIKKEIEKCVVLCSNHHREFHFFKKITKLNIDDYMSSSYSG